MLKKDSCPAPLKHECLVKDAVENLLIICIIVPNYEFHMFINLATCMMFLSLQPGPSHHRHGSPGAAHDLELQVGGSSSDSRPVDWELRRFAPPTTYQPRRGQWRAISSNSVPCLITLQ